MNILKNILKNIPQENPEPSRERRCISVYNPETGRSRTIWIYRKNFQSDEEMEKYIKNLKDFHKKQKEIKKKNEINSILNREYDETPIEQIKKEMSKMYVNDNIHNFHLDKDTANSCLILGSSKAGKTVLAMKIYQEYYEPDKNLISTIFAGNKQNSLYKRKNLLISEGFNKKSEKYISLQKYINTHTKNKYRFLNIFDDILDQKHNTLLNNMIMSYRNSNISSIILLQYTRLLSKQCRASVNNIFITKFNTAESKKDVIDIYLKDKLMNLGLKTYQEMINFFDEVTNNYGFFYIHNGHNPIFSIHRLRL
jgi:hypothetical protein